jgi:hypothetical protein
VKRQIDPDSCVMRAVYKEKIANRIQSMLFGRLGTIFDTTEHIDAVIYGELNEAARTKNSDTI